MFDTITAVSAADPSSPPPTMSRRAFGRQLGLSTAGLALAGCAAPDSSADSVPAQDAASQAAVTPDGALMLLADGNARCVAATPVRRDYSDQIRATAAGQYPFAVVLGCIDSRVLETVFDQGIGDIFTARIAGNIVNTELLGSMEFACQLAGAKLVVVLGHTSCGAVKGAIRQRPARQPHAARAKDRASRGGDRRRARCRQRRLRRRGCRRERAHGDRGGPPRKLRTGHDGGGRRDPNRGWDV